MPRVRFVGDPDGMAQRALAHVLLPAWLYREQRYRLPEDVPH